MKVHLPTAFDFEGNDVKVIYLKNGNDPFYNATHVARALGYKSPSVSALDTLNALRDKLLAYGKMTGKTIVENQPVAVANTKQHGEIVISDGVATIISLTPSSKTITNRHYYFYNQEALYEVLLMSNGETADRFRYWLTHEVIPSIARTGEYIAHRKDGIAMRRTLTDAIKLGIDNKELKDTAYAGITDAVYFIRYGVHTDVLRRVLQVGEGENIREKLDQDELDVLARLESDIAGGINLGMPLEQILTSARLIKIYRRSLL